MQRDTRPRYCIYPPSRELLDYPLAQINNVPGYSLNEITGRLVTQITTPDPGNFPHNIDTIIWAYELYEGYGFGDWYGLFILNDGRYCYMTAWCESSDFDGQANIFLFVDDNLENLIQFGMDDRAYRLYYEQTVPRD